MAPWPPCASRAWSARAQQQIASCNLLGIHAGAGQGSSSQILAPCTNQIRQLSSTREDLRNNARPRLAPPPVLIPPITELDQHWSSSVVFRARYHPFASLSSSALYLSSHCGPLQCPGPPRRRHHPSKTTHRQVSLLISVLAAYTTQFILHAVSC